jgi:hypothetical protein
MATLRRPHLYSGRASQVPKLHESYTTYLYWGFALVFAVLMVLGFTAF